jgi:hypothetical protein
MPVPYPLASFVGGPDTGSYASLQTAFNDLMGTAPTIINQYVDGSQTPAQWPSSVSYGASTFNQSGMCGDKIPLIGMPMSSSALSDQDNLAYLEAVANTTQYDANIRGVVTTWKNAGHSTQYWRPGVEMNLNSTPGFNAWASNTAPWVAAFRKIYSLLHEGFVAEGVTGLVIWNPGTSNSSAAGLATETLYPGDGYVDAIGADSYGDVWSQGPSNEEVLSSPENMIAYYNDPAEGGSEASDLSPHVLMQFAIDHGKPFCVCESGCGDGPPHDVDDNGVWPGWLRGALDTYVAKGLKVLFVSVWDCPPYAFSGDGSKPNQAAAWAAAFGANASAPPVTPPVTPPSPNESPSPTTITNGHGSLVDSKDQTWTIKGGQLYIGTTVVSSSANVTTGFWYKGILYQENSAGDWYEQPLSNTAGTLVAGAPPGWPPTPPPAAHAPSTAGTYLPPAPAVAVIYDTAGTAWTLPAKLPGQIYRQAAGAATASVVPSSANVEKLWWTGTELLQLNSAGQWWTQPLDGSAGTSTTAPSGYTA